jgi:citrate lyase subunit beta/citryl-CoA lyase
VTRVREATTFLFVPGDRPERFAKAAASGARLIVLDLEDAVTPDRKVHARERVVAWLADHPDCAVRVNASGTAWHEDDLSALARHRCVVMLPKAEPATTRIVAGELGESNPLIALIETATGVVEARAIAAVPGVQRLAFGSFDLATELGVDPAHRGALVVARGALVLASAGAGLPGPVDGVTADLHDEAKLTDDVQYGRRLGFTGKLCVHPKQVPVADVALRPTPEEVRWARSVIGAAGDGAPTAVDGQMVDKPVRERAERIIRQAGEGQ